MNINNYERQQVQNVIQDWRLTPATFAHKISRGQWIPAPHLMYISSRVAKSIAKGNARIIISAPPRHGKSQLTSIYMPAWALERFPNKQIILCAYGADLSVGFGRKVRDMLRDPQNVDMLRCRIRQDSSKVAAFQTETGGQMASVGLGGPITGRGADILLIDDYIKEIKEALSPAYREYVWNWFTTTAFTRLEPGGSCIIIATRWHSDDLIGRVLTNFPGQWEYIELPAIAGESDLLGRQEGEALFPQRYPIERLMDLKETLGSLFFEALYQQRPVDESKKISDGKWLKIIPEIPLLEERLVRRARVWDLAATEDGGDYTVGTKLAFNRQNNNTYLENVLRKQLSPNQVEQLVRNTALLDGVDTDIYIEQEPGASGKHLVEHFKNTVLKEFRVHAIPTTNAKLIRAQPFISAAEAGKVFLLEGAWNQTFIKEFDAFPGSQNDDQVDTAGAAYLELSGKKIFSASWGRTVGKGHTSNSNAIKQASFNMAAGSQRASGAVFGR